MSQTSEMVKPKTGEVSWNELVTTDTNAAGSFYGKLFGWKTAPFEGGEPGSPPYTLFKLDPNTMGVGGMMQVPNPQMPAQWLPYVVVDDIDATLAKATKLGAKSIVPVMEIDEIGRVCVIQDPQGATFGLHEFPSER